MFEFSCWIQRDVWWSVKGAHSSMGIYIQYSYPCQLYQLLYITSQLYSNQSSQPHAAWLSALACILLQYQLPTQSCKTCIQLCIHIFKRNQQLATVFECKNDCTFVFLYINNSYGYYIKVYIASYGYIYIYSYKTTQTSYLQLET